MYVYTAKTHMRIYTHYKKYKLYKYINTCTHTHMHIQAIFIYKYLHVSV